VARYRDQRDVVKALATATIVLPSREHGDATLPEVPAELQHRAIEMFTRHQ